MNKKYLLLTTIFCLATISEITATELKFFNQTGKEIKIEAMGVPKGIDENLKSTFYTEADKKPGEKWTATLSKEQNSTDYLGLMGEIFGIKVVSIDGREATSDDVSNLIFVTNTGEIRCANTPASNYFCLSLWIPVGANWQVTVKNKK